MEDERYIKRVFDNVVEFSLRSKGALAIAEPNKVAYRMNPQIADFSTRPMRKTVIQSPKVAPLLH